MEIVSRPKDQVPSLKRRGLVRLGDVSPSCDPSSMEEPTFQISEIVEPSLSNATSQEPSTDKELPLVVRDVSGPSRRVTGSEDAVSDGDEAFDDPASKNP